MENPSSPTHPIHLSRDIFLAFGSSGDALLPCSEASPRSDAVHWQGVFPLERHRMGSTATVSGLFPRHSFLFRTNEGQHTIDPHPTLLPCQKAEEHGQKWQSYSGNPFSWWTTVLPFACSWSTASVSMVFYGSTFFSIVIFNSIEFELFPSCIISSILGLNDWNRVFA